MSLLDLIFADTYLIVLFAHGPLATKREDINKTISTE